MANRMATKVRKLEKKVIAISNDCSFWLVGSNAPRVNPTAVAMNITAVMIAKARKYHLRAAKLVRIATTLPLRTPRFKLTHCG